MSFITDQSDSVRPRDSAIEPIVVRPRAARRMYGNCSLSEDRGWRSRVIWTVVVG
jgi:hypothetical protein